MSLHLVNSAGMIILFAKPVPFISELASFLCPGDVHQLTYVRASTILHNAIDNTSQWTCCNGLAELTIKRVETQISIDRSRVLVP